jgi:hypothetical protein
MFVFLFSYNICTSECFEPYLQNDVRSLLLLPSTASSLIFLEYTTGTYPSLSPGPVQPTLNTFDLFAVVIGISG